MEMIRRALTFYFVLSVFSTLFVIFVIRDISRFQVQISFALQRVLLRQDRALRKKKVSSSMLARTAPRSYETNLEF